MRQLSLFTLFLCILGLLTSMSGVTQIAQAQVQPAQEAGVRAKVATAPENLMQPGQAGSISSLSGDQLYRLEKCLQSGDGYAPCYTSVTKGLVSGGVSPLGSTTTQTQRCTRNMYDSFGTLVMQLWEDVNVTWWWSSYFNYYSAVTINWASRGTWTLDWRYTWGNLSGPSPSSGTYNGQFNVVTSGTAYYLGLSWVNTSVTQTNRPLATYIDWGCS